jgi:Phage capsid family
VLANTVFNPGVRPAEFTKQKWADEARSIDWLVRAAVAPAQTTVPSWAAELAQVSRIFVSSLTAISAGADLLQRGLQLNFDNAQSILLPLINPGTASFLREGMPIPVRKFQVQAGATLVPCKLSTSTVLTREMLESSNAETVVTAALAESVGPALDAALFSTSVATPDAPAGLLAGVAPLPASTATPLSDAMMADLSTLIGAVARVAGNSEVCIVAAPEQATAIRLMAEVDDYPIMASAALPKGEVIAVAAAALASVFEGVPQVEASREVALQMDDSAPGDPNAGKTTMSTFQTDSAAIKMRMPASWVLRSINAIAWMQTVSW